MGKASELKAAWQLSFFVLTIFILIVIALPTRGMAHDVEWKIFLLSLVFLAIIFRSERDKRKSPSLTSFFNHVQSTLLAVICMIVFFGLVFLFGYLAFGLLSAVTCFLIIWRNPGSVRYVPYIINFPMVLSTLVGDFDPMYLPGWILTAVTSAFGYYLGTKKAKLSHGR